MIVFVCVRAVFGVLVYANRVTRHNEAAAAADAASCLLYVERPTSE